ncbi:hypothetical protein [Bradyrhizobium sp. McL0616]|uniref:hypothetical protein n=1 Tax=Bradyrhizobium sp. McL0616 TaxID=3415674 RepID=UPI003CF1815C
MGLLPQTFVFVVRRKPIRTDGLKVICDLAKPRLLQPDNGAAISAFGATALAIKNAKTTPCTVAVKGLGGSPMVKTNGAGREAGMAGVPPKYLI